MNINENTESIIKGQFVFYIFQYVGLHGGLNSMLGYVNMLFVCLGLDFCAGAISAIYF